jgi:hypothetical protein
MSINLNKSFNNIEDLKVNIYCSEVYQDDYQHKTMMIDTELSDQLKDLTSWYIIDHLDSGMQNSEIRNLAASLSNLYSSEINKNFNVTEIDVNKFTKVGLQETLLVCINVDLIRQRNESYV